MPIMRVLRKERKCKWPNLGLKLGKISKLNNEKKLRLILIAECEYHRAIWIRLIHSARKHCRVAVKCRKQEGKNLGKLKILSCKNH